MVCVYMCTQHDTFAAFCIEYVCEGYYSIDQTVVSILTLPTEVSWTLY